jgi:hypothetical protein
MNNKYQKQYITCISMTNNIPKTSSNYYHNQLINSIKTLSIPLSLTSIALSANAADEVVKKTKKPKVKGIQLYNH